jgi:hypothetical protein
MQLFNRTPLAARVDASELEGAPARIGVVTAKATYRFDTAGRVELETQDPIPLFQEDQATPVGVLPSDLEPRRDRAFEVILLGHAYGPGGTPVESIEVGLAVGAVQRRIVVTGDRAWIGSEAENTVPTRAAPFTVIPLTYERAYGGKQVALLDAASEFEVTDPINPHGRGFDADLYARQVGTVLRSPAGYPKLPGYRRLLPNLEAHGARVRRWDDAPEPVCWATTPRDVTIRAYRKAREPAPGGAPLTSAVDEALYRAHPDWVVAIPPSAPVVRMENLTDERPTVEMRIPDQRVVADYVIEGRSGSRTLIPQMLVLLPDERRFYLLFRMFFTFRFVPGDERAFRLSLERSWYSGEDPSP